MKWALFSDLHNDESGFSKLLEHAAFITADKRICLGDIVNAQSEQDKTYFEKVLGASDEVLMGNHEAVLTGMCDVDVFNPKLRDTILRAKAFLESHDQAFLNTLRSLPLHLSLGEAQATHASFNPQTPWYHIRYTEDVQAEEPYLPTQINFVAHGHVPFIAWKEGGYWYYERAIYDQRFKLRSDTKYVINSGSVLGSREMRHYEKTFLVYDDQQAEVHFYNFGG